MKINWKILLVLVLVLSFWLRFYHLDKIPGSLNPDEKFNGYLAYSLLTTGKDLWGNFWPLTTRTFGSWTLIGMPLVMIPSVAILGLSEMAERIPGVILGLFGTGLIFWVSNLLFKSKRTALLAALFYALSPWGIFLSRISHETVLGFTIFLLALGTFLSGQVIWAGLFFGLSLLTHYAYFIFTPLFLAGLVFIYRRQWKSLLIFTPFFLVVGLGILRGSIGEVKDLGIFDSRDLIYWRVERFRNDQAHPLSDPLVKFHTKYLGISYQLAQNYLAVFSPTYLFDKGGEGLFHNLGFYGQLYLYDAVFILAGIIFLAKQGGTSAKIILLWILISPLASIFTKDNPNSTRLYPLLGGLIFLSSFGAAKLLKNYFIIIGASLATIVLVFWFLEAYFVHFNVQRVRFLNFGYKEAALVAQKYPDKKIVMVGPENFAYISFLFYNHYSPDLFRKEVSYYAPKTSGFQFVKSFNKFEFKEKIDRSELSSDTLYIDYAKPWDNKNLISFPWGEALFTFFTKEEVSGN